MKISYNNRASHANISYNNRASHANNYNQYESYAKFDLHKLFTMSFA